MNFKKLDPAARLIRTVSAIGTFHFALSVTFWTFALLGALWSLGPSRMDWSILPQSLPAVGLLAAFLFSFRLSRASLPLAGTALLTTTLLAIASFRYDMAHDRYQIHTFSRTGCSHGYVTWFWWRYDR